MDLVTNNSPSREPPRIIRVPPPEHDVTAREWALITFALGIVALIAACSGLLAVAGLLLGGAVLTQVIRRWVHRRYLRRRAEQLRDWPDATSLISAAIVRDWSEHRHPPSAQWICELLTRSAPPSATAQIVGFGSPTIPEVGDLRFEPRILSPTDIYWRRFGGLWPLGVVSAWYLLAAVGLVPPPDTLFGIWAVAGTGVLAIWIWKSGVRPTYVRLAPGIVQFLTYGPAAATPRIRSYPMLPGTLVVVSSKENTFTFRRDGREDKLHLESTRNRKDSAAALWNALLSTAPIPQMSETDLVG